jgi:bla regulator protein blaR1
MRIPVRVVAAATAVAALVPVMLAAQLPFLPNQGPPPDPNLRFDVASVKAADPTGGGMMMRLMPGAFETVGVPLRLLLRQALQKPDYQVIGAPNWVDTERYTVAAKAPAGSPPNANAVMLVNLLKDRFQLAMHTETRELPIFNLVVARADGRLGPGLKESSAECQAARAGGPGAANGPGGGPAGDGPGRGAPGGGAGIAAGRGALPGTPGGPPMFDPNAPIPCGSMRTGPGMLGAGGRTIAQLVQMLSGSTGRPVVDKTGLTSLYDFSLKFAPEPGSIIGPAPPPGVLPPPDPDAPNLFTAVQEQLGLKLENARGPIEVVVIDRIEKPSLD